MQQRIGLHDGRLPTGHFRNTPYMIDESRPYLDSAHAAGLMAVQGRSTVGRTFALGTGPVESRPEVVEFVRCSYLGLDKSPFDRRWCDRGD